MRLCSYIFFGLLTSQCLGETSHILIVGVFHFSNPQRDAVKIDQIDVTDGASQQYLERVAQRFALFRPTKVLQEFHPDQEAEINEQFNQFLTGEFKISTSELHQLGFRIARESKLDRMFGMDEWRPLMKFGELQDYMGKFDTASLERFQRQLANFAAEEEKAHSKLTIKQLLIRQNQEQSERENMSLYLSTNHVGAGAYSGQNERSFW